MNTAEILILHLAIYVFSIPIINILLSCIPGQYLPKWFKPKRFEGKVSPIYKLQEDDDWLNNKYHICKYELRWVRMGGLEHPIVTLIPFIGLFRYYRYKEVGNYGDFKESFIKENPDFNIKKHYLELERDDLAGKFYRRAKEEKLQNSLDNINKEFNNNFTL